MRNVNMVTVSFLKEIALDDQPKLLMRKIVKRFGSLGLIDPF